MYHTALFRNQRCIRHCWYGISTVWYSADSELALYPTTLISVFKGMFLPNHFSFEAISAFGYSADSDLMLYPTTLIQNQRCMIQHWFGISAVSDSADSRIFTFEYKYLREFETELKNILKSESGAHMGSIREKTRGKKSRATVPLISCIVIGLKCREDWCKVSLLPFHLGWTCRGSTPTVSSLNSKNTGL
jgi:hypothetical protein